MAINIDNEEILTLAQAARGLPRLRNDRPVAPSTIWRWSQHGIRGHHLETTKIGGTTVTSKEALARFFDAVNRKSQSPSPSTARGQLQQQEQVEKDLAELGA